VTLPGFRLPYFILRISYILIILWILTMISIPIVRWTLGDAVLPWQVTAGVVLQAAAVLAILVETWGVRRTLRLTALILPLAWLVEYMGSTTGFPFGAYHYTDLLQPQLGGVPVIIPLAWLMMLPCAWAVGLRVCELRITNYDFSHRYSTSSPRHLVTLSKHPWAFIEFVLVSAAAFTAWDFFLDPQMVAWGYWVWTPPGGYFGIPWVNFVGWYGAAALITALSFWLLDLGQERHVARLTLQATPLLLYTITWLLQSVGQLLFWQMPGPALAGFIGMGLFVGLSFRLKAK
jgi:putative membrane protein